MTTSNISYSINEFLSKFSDLTKEEEKEIIEIISYYYEVKGDNKEFYPYQVWDCCLLSNLEDSLLDTILSKFQLPSTIKYEEGEKIAEFFNYKVKEYDVRGLKQVLGTCYKDHKLILIQPDLDEDNKLNTYRHELIHAHQFSSFFISLIWRDRETYVESMERNLHRSLTPEEKLSLLVSWEKVKDSKGVKKDYAYEAPAYLLSDNDLNWSLFMEIYRMERFCKENKFNYLQFEEWLLSEKKQI